MAGGLTTKTAVLIAGGGVAALEAALALRELARDRVRVELLAPEPRFWYRPAAVAEPFALGEARHFDLSRLALAADAGFVLDALASIDADRHEAHTTRGAVLRYDALLLACGAVPKAALPGALTFRGPADATAFASLLEEIEAGEARRVAFVVPRGTVWALPIYELALMTAARAHARGVRDLELALVTPEERPLELFGREASDSVRDLLDERAIVRHARSYATEAGEGELRLLSGAIPADRVVALPRLEGQQLDGVPQTIERFVPVDPHGVVPGLEGVFAAGDITSFPVKQGGLASQQAVAASESIAALAGVALDPEPFRPVLRGMLLTGARPRYLRRDLTAATEASWVSETPIWWPPTKVVGRYLVPFLAELTGEEPPSDDVAAAGTIPVDVEIAPDEVERLSRRRLDPWGSEHFHDDAQRLTASHVMAEDPLIVAPEDTIGEVAERMRALDVGSALVAQFGQLIGVLTARDLIRALAGRVHSSEARVRQWMTAEPISVTPATPIDKAVLLMTEHGIHHLAVVEGERPVGLLELRDATRSAVAHGRLPIGLGL